jgi:hypothetical protein
MSPAEKFAGRLLRLATDLHEFGDWRRASQLRSIARYVERGLEHPGGERPNSSLWCKHLAGDVRRQYYLSDVTRRLLLGDVQCLTLMPAAGLKSGSFLLQTKLSPLGQDTLEIGQPHSKGYNPDANGPVVATHLLVHTVAGNAADECIYTIHVD